ncbi:MAG: nucleoside 2-deoxyribosyltransferase domain-containing protein [Exilibacterium sp.]
MKVFLGGTCNGSTWRDDLIKSLKIDYLNPVVEDWTPECKKEEIRQREECDFCLYVITPKMTGVYSIAEAVDDSNKRPEKTCVCILVCDGGERFSNAQIQSMQQTLRLVAANGAAVFCNLRDAASFLNSKAGQAIKVHDKSDNNDEGIGYWKQPLIHR